MTDKSQTPDLTITPPGVIAVQSLVTNWRDPMHRRLICDDQPPDFTLPDFKLSDVTMADACRVLEALGPMPGEALAALVDYGLSDAEI